LRLGILGGAFNPPHIGHLILAQEAHSQLSLDAVLLVPFREPPHRALEPDPGPEVRHEMALLAAADDERLAVSRIEIDRPGPSYTVETLRELRRERPDDELYLVMGGDQAGALPSWREPAEVLALATVAVAERSDWRRERIAEELRGLAGADAIEFFEMPRVEVSSTLVRERVAAGRPIRYLVPDRVASYVGARGLYGASAPVAAR
jgi:nicotinate-nucleotide adenylyltransferase